MNPKILIAVSGGADSMFLLDQYRSHNCVVAHINYHKRADSDQEEQVVKAFCSKHNIPLEILHVKEKHTKNFQNWAREIRYHFFAIIYQKYQCQKLLIAHHKDDFIETCFLQVQKSLKLRSYGIHSQKLLLGMNVVRPLLFKYWKSEIIKYCLLNKITFANDYTNQLLIYNRNIIRDVLLDKTLKEKQTILQFFLNYNQKLAIKFKKIDKIVYDWKQTKYQISFFKNQIDYQNEILFQVLHSHFKTIKVSKGLLDSLIQFIKGQEGNKHFIVSKNNHAYVKKNNQKLIFFTKD